LFDSTIRFDSSFFDQLDRIVQSEPWLDPDRAMIDQLMSLGIEKGKVFKPDTETRYLLDAAALEAKAWLEAKYDAAGRRSSKGHSGEPLATQSSRGRYNRAMPSRTPIRPTFGV
jgi:hypothetical protein